MTASPMARRQRPEWRVRLCEWWSLLVTVTGDVCVYRDSLRVFTSSGLIFTQPLCICYVSLVSLFKTSKHYYSGITLQYHLRYILHPQKLDDRIAMEALRLHHKDFHDFLTHLQPTFCSDWQPCTAERGARVWTRLALCFSTLHYYFCNLSFE